MFTRSDLQAVVPQLLQRLGGITTLPQHGTVAGQAVASLLFEELGLDIRGPINDVDVFVSVDGKQPKTSVLSKFSSEDDKYHQIKFISSNNHLSIVSTSTTGLLNTTCITHPGARDNTPHGQNISQLLVDGFDLNLVAVGVNLTTQEIVCSTAFLTFLTTREIKVASTLTPAHTLVRLARKVHSGQLHNIECDYPKQRGMLEQVMFLNTHSSFDREKLKWVMHFGDRYKTHVEQLSAHLPNVLVDPANDLFVFDIPSTPERENILQMLLPLVDSIGQGGRAFLFHYNFDRFLEALKLNHPHQITYKDLLEASLDSGISDGRFLSLANQMMGGQELIHPIGMDENDCAVLFLQYDQRDDGPSVAKIVTTYNHLSQFEKDIFLPIANLNILSDFATDPLHWAYKQLDENTAILQQWSDSLQDAHDSALFVQLMERVGTESALRERLSVDCLNHLYVSASNLFTRLPHTQKMEAFASVLTHIYSGVEGVRKLESSRQLQLLKWAHISSVDIEPIFNLSSNEARMGFLLAAGDMEFNSVQKQNIKVALALVSDDSIMSNGGYVLSCLLHNKLLPVLRERTACIDSTLWNSSWSKNMLTTLEHDPERKAVFENLTLSRAIGSQKSSSIRRKM